MGDVFLRLISKVEWVKYRIVIWIFLWGYVLYVFYMKKIK